MRVVLRGCAVFTYGVCGDRSVPDQKICLDTIREPCFECRGLETPRMRNWDSDDSEYVSSSEEEESGDGEEVQGRAERDVASTMDTV